MREKNHLNNLKPWKKLYTKTFYIWIKEIPKRINNSGTPWLGLKKVCHEH